jgi:topoisomerase-4 subunit A
MQAEAILNMRLRSLRRLEELEIRKEHADLTAERADLQTLLSDESLRWKRIDAEIAETGRKFGAAPLGTRRTVLAAGAPTIEVAAEAFIEREPITVVLSQKGWIRALRGHLADGGELKFKEEDGLRLLVPAETTDRLCLFATNGRAHTLKAADLPRGRGDGQAVRLLADLANEDEIAALFVWRPGLRYLVASTGGRGFLVPAEDLIAEKRTGKQVLNLRPGEEAALCIPAEGDHVAVIGSNRKLLIFSLDQVPEMGRGSGVMLQKYRDGALADARVFRLAEGLSWRLGEKTRTETNLTPWIGERGQAGHAPPNGFPKSGKFG